MATTTVEELVKLLAGKFDISDSLLKEVTNKAVGVASKKAEQTVKERFKEGGVFGLAKDFFTKNKPKEQDNKTLLGSLKGLFEKNKPKEQDLIKDEEKPIKVLIDGITDNGYKDLASKLPDILKGAFDISKLKDPKTKEEAGSGGGLLSLLPTGIVKLLSGALMAGGGIALLLGGLAALITGLETEGPWKGTLKILSKVGLEGGLSMLKKGAVKFIENFKIVSEKVINLFKPLTDKISNFLTPLTDKISNILASFKDKISDFLIPFKDKILQIFNSIKNKIGNIFSPLKDKIVNIFTGLSDNLLKFVSGIGDSIIGFFKGSTTEKGLGFVGKMLSGAKGIFGRIFGSIVKILKPIAKRIPVLGTVIGLGFAYTRFKSGDTVGGIIDVLSAIATLVPFAGTAVSIGLDVLNAFLDYKAGGSDQEAGQKKTGMIGDLFGGIWGWIKDKVTGLFSWFTDLGGKLLSGKWGDAFEQIAGWIPGLDWVLGFLGTDKESLIEAANVQGSQNVDMIGNLMSWMKKSIWGKVTGFADNLVGAVKDWWGGVVNWWSGEKTEGAPPMPQNNAPKADPNELGLAEGGIVKKPIKSWVGEAGPEAVIPLDKYMSPEGFKISNDLLGTIATNTATTNETIRNLSHAILQLAGVFDKKQSSGNNIVINGGDQQQYPSASQVASSNIDPIRQIRMQFAV
jgi:phage-related protein